MDLVQTWLDQVAYSHSKSRNTEILYQYSINEFCSHIEKTPQQIVDEYERLSDRKFRRKYAQFLRAYISHLQGKGLAVNTMNARVSAVRSFFKYNDLPLGYVPVAKNKVTFHNRDLSKQEVIKILSVSRPRDKAFFAMSIQSGLRPATLCSLKLKHIQPDFKNGVIPCKVKVPQDLAKGEFGSYFSFMAEESVKYLRAYLDTRANINSESYLFTHHGTEEKSNPKSFSHVFARTINKLRAKGLMDIEQKERGKPRNVRLYNLRKFFRKHGGQVGIEYVNFWMGHKTNYKAPHIPASDEHYFNKEDVEFHRKLYAEKAMPFLRIETATPTETEQTIKELRNQLEERHVKIEQLERDVHKYKVSVAKQIFAIADLMKQGFVEQLKKAETEEEKKALKKLIEEYEEIQSAMYGNKRKCEFSEVCSEYGEDEYCLCIRDYENCDHFKFLKKQQKAA